MRSLVVVTLCLLAASAAVPTSASAQDPSGPGAPVPAWEVEASVHYLPGVALGEALDGFEYSEGPFGSASVGAGRIFLGHLRAFAAIGTERAGGATVADSYTSVPSPAGHLTDHYEPKGAVYTTGVTWQFREHARVHPYASVGANFGRYRHERSMTTYVGISYRTQVLTRDEVSAVTPTYGLGVKWESADRGWYVRPEMSVVVDKAGEKRGLATLGIGLAF